MLPIMIELHPMNINHKNVYNAFYIKRLESVMCVQYDKDGKPMKDTPDIERCMIQFVNDDQFPNTATVDETVDEVLHKIDCAIAKMNPYRKR